ncbi:hypothetical protein LCGC14_1976400, partial [marine sediment metagenome]
MERSDPQFPEVVCLCGSTRYLAEISVMAWELEKLGRIVLSMHLLPQSYPGVLPDHQAEAEGVKEAMDELHFRKIDLADRVLVMDVHGYIGNSARREIEYATRTGKPIDYIAKCEGLRIEDILPRGDNHEEGKDANSQYARSGPT